jgi:hypothetical protein
VDFTVTWKAVSGATSYTLQQTSLDTGRVATKYTGSATSISTSVGLAGFYQLAAKACNANGCSAWANVPNTTDAEPSGGPQSISMPISGGSAPASGSSSAPASGSSTL